MVLGAASSWAPGEWGSKVMFRVSSLQPLGPMVPQWSRKPGDRLGRRKTRGLITDGHVIFLMGHSRPLRAMTRHSGATWGAAPVSS